MILEQMLREHLAKMDELRTQQSRWVSGFVKAIAEGKTYDIPDRPFSGDNETFESQVSTQQLDGTAGRSDAEKDNGRTTQKPAG
jgi:hypothetical protein